MESTMVFCAQCGNATTEQDAFCGRCGARQPLAGAAAAPPPPPPAANAGPLAGISDRKAAILCYLPFLGIIMAIIVLASDRFRASRSDVRFHAFQGLFLAIAYQIVDKIIGPMFLGHWRFGFGRVSGLVELALIGVGIYMMVATSNGEKVQLPLIGEMAEKSAAEQS